MTDKEKINENANQEGCEKVNEVDKLKAEYDAKFEALKKELSTRDIAINKINKEKEAKELASKTAEEQAEIFRKKADQLERKEAYRQSLKEAGLDPDRFLEIINETDPKAQASKFAEILVEKSTQSANEALEMFKRENLGKIPAEPKGTGEAPGGAVDYQSIYRDMQKIIR
jgi:translation elongation factor EF-G